MSNFVARKTERETRNAQRETRNAKRQTPNAKRETRNAKRQTPNAKRETRNAKRQTRNAQRETPNAKRETPNAKRETPNAKRQTPNAKRMLESLITSKTRIKLLLKFFLNSTTTSYLRDLAAEFGESTNAIRLELNHLEEAGLLNSKTEGNKKLFIANRKHPLYYDIHRLLLKHTGIDHIVENVVTGLGGLDSAYVTGSFARGRDNPVIELLLVGQEIDRLYLDELVSKAAKIISRNIQYSIVNREETAVILHNNPEALLLWKQTDNQN